MFLTILKRPCHQAIHLKIIIYSMYLMYSMHVIYLQKRASCRDYKNLRLKLGVCDINSLDRPRIVHQHSLVFAFVPLQAVT